MLVAKLQTEDTPRGTESYLGAVAGNFSPSYRYVDGLVPITERRRWLSKLTTAPVYAWRYVGRDKKEREIYVAPEGRILDPKEQYRREFERMLNEAKIAEFSAMRDTVNREWWAEVQKSYEKELDRDQKIVEICKFFLEHLAED